MSSNDAGKWSIEEMRRAIIAALLPKVGGTEFPRLMFSELEAELGEDGRPVYPATLNKALKAMKKNGEVTGERGEKDHRKVYYSLEKIIAERAQRDAVPIAASADIKTIRSTSMVGAIYNIAAGWSVYGVSWRIPKSVRLRISSETEDFGDRVDDLLSRESHRFIHSVVQKARRLDSKGRRSAELALRRQFDGLGELGGFAGFGSWASEVLDTSVPGSPKIMGESAPPYPDDPERQVRWWSRITGAPEEYLRRKKVQGERDAKAIGVFLGALPRRTRERTALTILAWVQLLSS